MDDALFNYVDTALPFFQASADCLASYGGSLASIHSETENTAVYELNPTLEARWIGLYEASDVEDVFSWTDGTNVTYTNWQDGEPNNFLGNPEKCGVMHKLSGADVAAGPGMMLNVIQLHLMCASETLLTKVLLSVCILFVRCKEHMCELCFFDINKAHSSLDCFCL